MVGFSSAVGEQTIGHNQAALENLAAFGMENIMALLLYPIAAILRDKTSKVLIVGPRPEDDIFCARTLGLEQARGLALFSYSSFIDIGDIHKTAYEDHEFDSVLVGWVVSYSADPASLIAECKRITRPGGYLGFGLESNPQMRRTGEYAAPRANSLNSWAAIAEPVGGNSFLTMILNSQIPRIMPFFSRLQNINRLRQISFRHDHLPVEFGQLKAW